MHWPSPLPRNTCHLFQPWLPGMMSTSGVNFQARFLHPMRFLPVTIKKGTVPWYPSPQGTPERDGYHRRCAPWTGCRLGCAVGVTWQFSGHARKRDLSGNSLRSHPDLLKERSDSSLSFFDNWAGQGDGLDRTASRSLLRAKPNLISNIEFQRMDLFRLNIFVDRFIIRCSMFNVYQFLPRSDLYLTVVVN